MIYTFIILSLIIQELEANEISTLKSLWCILKLSYRMQTIHSELKVPQSIYLFYITLIFTFFKRRYMAEILPIRRKTLSNQSINQSQSINQHSLKLDLPYQLATFLLITCNNVLTHTHSQGKKMN